VTIYLDEMGIHEVFHLYPNGTAFDDEGKVVIEHNATAEQLRKLVRHEYDYHMAIYSFDGLTFLYYYNNKTVYHKGELLEGVTNETIADWVHEYYGHQVYVHVGQTIYTFWNKNNTITDENGKVITEDGGVKYLKDWAKEKYTIHLATINGVEYTIFADGRIVRNEDDYEVFAQNGTYEELV